MARPRKQFSQRKMEAAIRGSAGNIALISRKLGCSRETTLKNIHRLHLEKAVQDDFDNLVDTIEARAWQMAQDGDARIIIKMLESLKRDRYGDARTIEIKRDEPPVIRLVGFPGAAE